jgi:hypothetical protein
MRHYWTVYSTRRAPSIRSLPFALGNAMSADPLIISSHGLCLPSLILQNIRRLLRIPLRLLPPLLRHPPHIRHPLKDILRLPQNITPILKQCKWHSLSLTKCHQIMPLLRKQQIRLSRRTQIAHSIPSIQQRRLLAPRHLRNRLCVRPDGQTLIMPEPAVVMIRDRPPTFRIQITHRRLLHRLVRHDLDLLPLLLAQQMLQQCADDGHHPRRQHNYGDIVLDAPIVEGGEVWVQLDVLAEDGYAVPEGELPALEHGAEGVAECDLAVQGVKVALPALGEAEAVVVG